MASSFVEASDEGLWKQIHENSKTNTRQEVPTVEQEFFEVPLLNEPVSQFFAELRKENCNENKTGSLKVIQAALDRYLRSTNCAKSIARDTEFLSPNRVLEGSERWEVFARLEWRNGRILPSFTKQEEEMLWDNGQLGGETPLPLLKTVCWLLTMHFGLRGRQHHHDMKVENFSFQKDYGGVEYFNFFWRPQWKRQENFTLS